MYNIRTLQFLFPIWCVLGWHFDIPCVRLLNQPLKPSFPQPPTSITHIGEIKKKNECGERKMAKIKVGKKRTNIRMSKFLFLTQKLYTLYTVSVTAVHPLSLAKNCVRLYSSVYCDWSHSSSSPPRIAFKPFPVPINLGSPSVLPSACFEVIVPWKLNQY